MEQNEKGKLYIVATPIGNSRDMSPRGREILSTVDIIAAEDTRRSMVLLNKLEIRNRLVSNHKFNEYGKARYFVDEMLAGKSVAVITDAGTPCISDPGNELIRAAVEAGIDVVGVPGCCAAVTALSVSGFDLSSFLFYGFFPRENAERRKLLERLRRGDTRTFVFYESPKRIMELVDFFIDSEAGVEMCLCNDLTKLHEMSFRGSPSEVKDKLLAKGNYDKGEYAVVVEIRAFDLLLRLLQFRLTELVQTHALFKLRHALLKRQAAVLQLRHDRLQTGQRLLEFDFLLFFFLILFHCDSPNYISYHFPQEAFFTLIKRLSQLSHPSQSSHCPSTKH